MIELAFILVCCLALGLAIWVGMFVLGLALALVLGIGSILWDVSRGLITGRWPEFPETTET